MPNLKIGAHMSIAGGILNSLPRAAEIGANALQIFAKSPRGWHFVNDKVTDEDVESSKSLWAEASQDRGLIHSIYLVNLAKPFTESEKDRFSVIDDFMIAQRLGFNAVNLHLGKYGDRTKEETFANMKENVEFILQKVGDTGVQFLFENTAGQGSEVGWNFEELGEFLDYLGDEIKSKVKICFDTAHAWGAGYDLNKWDEVVALFDKYIGIDKLHCFHLNDSKALLGSKLDRHASIGKGFVGLPALVQVIKWAYEHDRTMFLETPEPDIWPQEIQMIKDIIDGNFDQKKIDQFHKENFKTQYLKKYEKQALEGEQAGLF